LGLPKNPTINTIIARAIKKIITLLTFLAIQSIILWDTDFRNFFENTKNIIAKTIKEIIIMPNV